MASRDLNDLNPSVKALAVQHIKLCADAGIGLLIYNTYRSNAEQDALYKIGRTIPGKIVTNKRGGGSKHNNSVGGKPSSLAYDCVGQVHGKAMWADDATYLKIGQLAESLGLTWAGRWTGKLREKCHMQLGD